MVALHCVPHHRRSPCALNTAMIRDYMWVGSQIEHTLVARGLDCVCAIGGGVGEVERLANNLLGAGFGSV